MEKFKSSQILSQRISDNIQNQSIDLDFMKIQKSFLMYEKHEILKWS